MSWKLSTYSQLRPRKSGRHWYAWCVFLDEDRNRLSKIEEVNYILHPTFPNPVRVSDDFVHRFAIISGGWGNFTIDVRIVLKGGQTERQAYPLSLSANSWPLGEQRQLFKSESASRAYNALLDRKWEWRSLSTLSREAMLDLASTKKLLEEMEAERLVRKSRDVSVAGEEFWGATCRLGLMPELSD
jgi:transcription initiation factor IIF auxiliary subunit